jgi:hypothetical protein
MPKGINTTVVLDRTTTIKASLHDVESSLILSVLLVILVVFLFLRNARATWHIRLHEHLSTRHNRWISIGLTARGFGDRLPCPGPSGSTRSGLSVIQRLLRRLLPPPSSMALGLSGGSFRISLTRSTARVRSLIAACRSAHLLPAPGSTNDDCNGRSP